MLKKTFRLSSSKDIRLTSLRGRSFFSPYFVVKFINVDTGPRFTVIVSTKVSRRAVERNRLKRIVREALRKSVTAFKPGNYVIIVKARAAGQSSLEITKQLHQLFSNVNLKLKQK